MRMQIFRGWQGQQRTTWPGIIGSIGNVLFIAPRGLIMVDKLIQEAERYREKAWKAYEERIVSCLLDKFRRT
jgi:uridine monophosphate synthetase